MLGMMIGMVIDMMQHEVPSSRNDWSYYKPAGEDCQEKREKRQSLRPFGAPPWPLAGKACSTLWLKMCHRHIFLTRRSLCTREAFSCAVKEIARKAPTKRLPLEGKLSPKVTDEVAVSL